MERSTDSNASAMASETDLLLPPNAKVAPRDRLHMVYLVLYLLGIGCLLPWNFFSNAKQYFMYKLRNTDNSSFGEGFESYHDPHHNTELQVTFESYLSVAAMVPNILFMFINTAATKLISLKVRMVTAALVMIAMFILTVALVKINTDDWQVKFFAVTLVTIVIMNASSAILQGGMFGLSSMFPGKYTQAVMGGMGMGGTLASVVNIIALSVTNNPLDMGFGYFLTAVKFIILALLGYLSLPLMKFARYHTTKNENARKQRASVNERQNNTTSPAPIPGAEPEVQTVQHSSLWSIFLKLWKYGFSVFMLFFVTLSCYPSVNSAIISTYSAGKWKDTYFMPVSCFLLFNVLDLSGRTLAGFIQHPKPERPDVMIGLSFARIIFIPLFLLCNVQPRVHLPVLFHSDVIPSVIMVIFAFTNGYFGTLCMMYGPRRIPPEDLETAGSMMSFFLAAGLGSGSLVSFALIKLV